MTCQALERSAQPELVKACFTATAGNPFYLHELMTALQGERRGWIGGMAGRVRGLGVGAIGRSVLVRLARLGGDCERLAQAVAALGAGAQLRHAAILAELPRERAEIAADRLRAADLLRAETALSFVHPIVAQAVAAELPASRRSSLHRRAAQALLAEEAPADRVAAHLLSVEPYGEQWVVDALLEAARSALSQGAPEAATSYLQRALAEPPAADARLDLLVELGGAQTYLPTGGDFPALRQAIELADDPQRRAEITIALAWALMGRGRNDEAAPLLERLLDANESLDQSLVERVETLLIGGAPQALDAAPRARARAVRYLERARRGEIDDPWLPSALAMHAPSGAPAAAEAAALARASVYDERLWGSWPAVVGSSVALTWADELEEAGRVQDRMIVESQRRGSAPMFMAASAFRSFTALRAGDLELAEEHAQHALEVAHEPVTFMVAASWWAAVLLECGRASEAAAVVEPIEPDDEALNLWHGCIFLAARGSVRTALGNPQRGLADLLDADHRVSAAGLQLSVLTDWVSAAISALIQLGRDEQARDLCARELDEAIAFGAPRRHGIALSLSGTLDPTEAGLVQLRQAVQLLERSPARLAHADALVNLGAGLRARGRREQARQPLSQGLDIAHRLGALALAARARAELIAVGARPRRAALRGPDALTPAEMRTARMAADGLTNREIAQALFLSTRTVEAQLSGAYTKLAINSRVQLADALGARRDAQRLRKP
jgi:DNA-binding CsgD family transcriptional regulator